jgi:metal-responsive CopG/Arc/MetJ family transcriptional regulator
MQKSITFSLPDQLLQMVDAVQLRRRDPTRSDTVRVLLLKALGDLGYLKEKEIAALTLRQEAVAVS